MVIKDVASKLSVLGLTMSTVESCTGGAIATKCTDLPGSSKWFLGSIVTYSNEMKVSLGVDRNAIESDGAVSQIVVEQMAEAGRQWCKSDWCIAVSGVAGPDGGSPEKPVGTVWFAWAGPGVSTSSVKYFHGNRASIREQAVYFALQQLFDFVK